MKKVLALALVLALLGIPLPVQAEESPIPIATAQELAAIAQDPAGSYVLTADIDMTGVVWKPLDFTGTLDGAGHSILNLTVSEFGDTTAKSFDGNYNVYDTYFAGLFGTLKNATVRNLNLVNVRAVLSSDTPCFLGGLAGYSELSTISGCYVQGTLELRAHDRMFGVAGVVGYGNGTVESSTADVTLILTDTDKKTLDESFLGGIFSTGFMDVKDCYVTIDGYCSDYGYVHTGGITGMYLQYPLGSGRTGYITGNHVTGRITFFEANSDRRAYCRAMAGEVLAFDYKIEHNTQEFTRDEKWEYGTELRPDPCATPVLTSKTVPAGCDTYGYTEYTCQSCGYTYRDRFTPFAHRVISWQVVTPATVTETGVSLGICNGCGKEFTRTDPVLEHVPTQPPTTPAPTTPAPTPAPTPASTEPPAPVPTAPAQAPSGLEDPALPFFLVLLALLCALAGVLICLRFKPRRHR